MNGLGDGTRVSLRADGDHAEAGTRGTSPSGQVATDDAITEPGRRRGSFTPRTAACFCDNYLDTYRLERSAVLDDRLV